MKVNMVIVRVKKEIICIYKFILVLVVNLFNVKWVCIKEKKRCDRFYLMLLNKLSFFLYKFLMYIYYFVK